MKLMNKKMLVSLSVLATPFVVESFTDNTAHANGQYTLNTDTKTYKTASNAVAGKAASTTYTKGNYYVYKQANGMINISKTPGKPGAWINPNTNTVVTATQTSTRPTTTTQTQTVAPTPTSLTYTLSSPTKTYATAANASKRVGATATYQSGTYHVYKNYNGMLNISRVAGRAGAWINPAEVRVPSSTPTTSQQIKPTTQTQKPVTTQTTPVTSSNLYTLNRDVKVYASAANAKQGVGARTTYKAGNYHIFRRSGDMLNISRVAGRAGAWINPAENSAQRTVEPTTTQPTRTQTTTRPTTSTTPSTTGNKYDGLEYKARYELTNDTAAYSNAASAKQGTGATSRYAKGTYYIYKNVNGMLNISKTPGKAGAWINPTASSSVVARTNAPASTGASLQSFQFKNLNSTSNYTATELNRALNAFGGGTGKLAGRGAAFKKAESTYNVNALYLLSHAALESGWGKSKIAADKNNFFGIAAYDNSPYESATKFDGVEAGIMDGAKWISGRYLKSNSFPASGPYLGDKTTGMNKYYATDPNWGYKIADIMNRINNYLGKKDR